MPINWALESLKWKSLVDSIQEVALIRAFKSVIVGNTLALVTPMRLGDYAGRVLFLDSLKMAKGIGANFISSLAQNIVNIGLGLIAFIYFIKAISSFDLFSPTLLLAFAFFLFSCILYIYFQPKFLIRWVQDSKVFQSKDRLKNNIEILTDISTRTKLDVLLLSLLRYFVYLVQYYCLLHFFGVTISFNEVIIGICTIYFIQSLLPLPSMIGIVARAEIVIVIWGALTDQLLEVLMASYLLWFINQIVPAIYGLWELNKIQFLDVFSSTRTEE
jgi:hypothetical protein